MVVVGQGLGLLTVYEALSFTNYEL